MLYTCTYLSANGTVSVDFHVYFKTITSFFPVVELSMEMIAKRSSDGVQGTVPGQLPEAPTQASGPERLQHYSSSAVLSSTGNINLLITL